MDNIEFVKAYERWKLFEAVDLSPERFARELKMIDLEKRVDYLIAEHLGAPDEIGYVFDILDGKYDEQIEAKEAQND